jgi:hypothetical protein
VISTPCRNRLVRSSPALAQPVDVESIGSARKCYVSTGNSSPILPIASMMSGPLRVEFPGAIYHVMCRGNGRQQIFHDDGDYQRLLDGLARTVNRYDWEMFSFVMMPNHFHVFLRTPQPNLSRGMQNLASG